MLLSNEWGSFRDDRKPLRVSSPRGYQRSTYFLQLPYIYAIPLLIMCGILHWLVSQSIFLANVTITDGNGNPVAKSLTTCGYSPIAIIFTLVLSTALLTFGIGLGFRKLNPHMPVVGSCSAAISAACHGPPDEVDAAFLPLQWGEVVVPSVATNPVGHCSFSSNEVAEPISGRMYAGLSYRGSTRHLD
jgi:hypothetical protein